MFFYSIYDVATGAYMNPFLMPADGQAMRAFSDLATDKNHEVGKHPEDYSLFRLGTFDNNKGYVTQDERIECLMTALEAIAAQRGRNETDELPFQRPTNAGQSLPPNGENT